VKLEKKKARRTLGEDGPNTLSLFPCLFLGCALNSRASAAGQGGALPLGGLERGLLPRSPCPESSGTGRAFLLLSLVRSLFSLSCPHQLDATNITPNNHARAYPQNAAAEEQESYLAPWQGESFLGRSFTIYRLLT
jgi:hypothetical protein